MGKDKKKHSKKDKASGDVLDLAHASVKKFRKVTKEFSRLSAGQKLVGGIALAAAGLVYLASQEAGSAPAPGPAPRLAPAGEDDPENAPAPSTKGRKRLKSH